ncbi:virB8 family protein [Sphingomonas adhaesiva]|uniref:virB8 family protein n=1 Tax=Sphingomonas adhaesiva TaxID=28212 RepID=UPI002FFB2670
MKKNVTDQAAYFAQGASWAEDRQESLRRSRRVAWMVAGGLGVVAVCEALALVILMPLKTVEPYTLLVDRQTGFVQALKPLDAQVISGDRALTQSFLVQYVIAREGYDRDTIQSDYRKVGLWSASQARADYVTRMQATNPESPLVLYPRGTVDVIVKSVTPMTSASAMVRYDTRLRGNGGQTQPPQSWVAIVHYRYSGEPMSVADRFINPLGFQVDRYRRSMEVLPAPDSVTPAVAPPAASPVMPARAQ